jgi:photosystem II stability/assembly factor-like uncharacterized protein
MTTADSIYAPIRPKLPFSRARKLVMMKTRLVWATIAALLSTYVPAPLAADDDADMPPFAEGVTTKEEYRRLRDEYFMTKRGLPHFLPYEPRIKAIEELAAAEREAPLIDPTFWTEVGPNPIPNGQIEQGPATPVSGRTISIAIHPTNPDIVYVGTAQGGLYRSTNGGAVWTPLMDSAMSLAIGAVALAPSNPEILYVGTGEPNLSADSFFGVGLYRIDNASTTANLTGPINPAVTTGIAGTTAFTGRAISEILVHPTQPGTIFVSTATAVGGNPQGGSLGFTVPPLAMLGVYRSTNATTASPTFTKLSVTPGGSLPPDTTGNISITDIAMDPTDPNTMVAWAVGSTAAGNGGMFSSTNALAPTPTFTQTIITNTANARGEIAGNRVGTTVTFYGALGENTNGRIRRSTDGGATWSAALAGAQNFCSGQCFYDIAVAVNPTDANILNVGGSPTLIAARSTDGGATFTTDAQSAVGLHVDTHALAIAPSNPSVVYLGTDGGIYRSNDGGLTWNNLNNTTFRATQFQAIDLHPTDREFMIGGTQDNGTPFKRPDGTWFRADFGDGGYAIIDQNAPDTTNVVMYHTYFNQTTAMGFGRVTNVASATEGNWLGHGCGFGGFVLNGIVCPASAIQFYAPMARGPGNPNTLYFGSDQLFRSTNQGTTMPAASQVLQAGQSITTIGIAPSDDNFRIVGLRNGQIFATTTGANPMVNVTSPSMPPPNPADTQGRRIVGRAIFHTSNPNTAWVAFGGYGVPAGQHIWKTTNLSGGAATWVASGNGIPDVPVNGMAIDPAQPNTLYAATDIGIYASIDGGVNWFPYSEGLPRVAVFDIKFQNSVPRVLRIATHGRGIWERTPLPVPVELQGFEVK